jgi:hypothetical protein
MLVLLREKFYKYRKKTTPREAIQGVQGAAARCCTRFAVLFRCV